MEKQAVETPATLIHSIFFSGALSLFGLAVALTEFGSDWTIGLSTIVITTGIVFSIVVAISLFVFRKAKLRVVAVLVSLITLSPLAAWSMKPFRSQLFNSFAEILPVVALGNAVKNDFLKEEGICKRISSLGNGETKLIAMSKSFPPVAARCSAEIAKTSAGKIALLSKIENDDAFCEFVSGLDNMDSLLGRLLIRGSVSVNSQKCLSAQIDKQFETTAAFIQTIEKQKTADLVGLIAVARISKTSERLSSDELGEWLFGFGCGIQDPNILSHVGIAEECVTMAVDSGWPNICERVGSEIKMEKVCKYTRKFTLGIGINESKRIVHRAIRRFRDQIEAASIAQYDDTSYSSVSGLGGPGGGGGGGGGRGGGLTPSQMQQIETGGLLGLANGRVALGSRNAALMPVGVNQLLSGFEGVEMPSLSRDEWADMRENVFKQLLSGEFDDPRIAGFLDSKGLTDLLPGDKSMKDLFAAHGEDLSDQEAAELDKQWAKFKKNQDKSGKNKLAKNAPKKPRERVKKKRDRDN